MAAVFDEVNEEKLQYAIPSSVRLGDLFMILDRGKSIPYIELLDKEAEDGIPYILSSNLSEVGSNYYLDIHKIEKKIAKPETETIFINNEIYYWGAINQSVLLINLINPTLNPTYFLYQNQAIAIGPNIVALQMKDNTLNIEYVISQLQSQFVKAQLNEAFMQRNIPYISPKELLEIKIILPSVDEQYQAVIAFRKQLSLTLESELIQAKKSIKKTEFDVMSIAIHDLNQKLGAMETDLSVLKYFLTEKADNHTSISWEEYIVPVYDIDTPEKKEQQKLINVFQRILGTLNEAANQLNATREELQNNTLNPEKRYIKQLFLSEIAPSYNADDFSCVIEGENVGAEIDVNRIKTLARNLIENAKMHGSATQVSFHFSYLENNKHIRILYKNNGRPFPNDFDFERDFKGLYQKAFSSKGTGIGGYSINKTIELHTGSINLLPIEKGEIFPVQMEIILPIKYTQNKYYGKSNSYFTH